ncbi:hypothetical protein B0H66DRAFT_353006 [Apodospora peruviana]|uniref:Zn(2)-C6 fungal-type domain-containing protein n=1 Tax=Apodospora peruviana TaxID=516989 RepID=A0AAE0LZA8_9PEZI|nr:hypothetical protein B0H66DRAFT_353006 [Apodospora peruviana]
MHDPGRKSGNNSDSHSPTQSTFRPAHSGRKGSKKVRTGCITCKIRKVKCDEAKPFCIRCTKTGRRCDGYLPSVKRQRGSSHLAGRGTTGGFLDPHGSLTVFYEWASADEVRSFQFFQHVTAPCLSGDFDGAFWRVLVLQICQTEPAVKHAVLAVSSLHEGMMRGMVPYAELGDRQSFALWQYNKAIACLLDQMRHADAKPLVPLLTCVLFVCIEFMQSKDRESLIHLEQGRQILGQLGRKSRNPEIDIIKQHLVPVYTRLSLTSLMIGCDPVAIPVSLKTAVEIPVQFETIDEVRYTLYDFMDECLRFSKKSNPTKYGPVPPEEMRAFEDEQDYLLSKLAKFNVAFSLYQSTKAKEAPAGAIALIQIHIHTTFIWISTALSNRETAFDDHVTTFSAIIPLATSFMDSLGAPAARENLPGKQTAAQTPTAADSRRFSAMFAFEMHVIAPLYFVATKCRHPIIRRSALRLLRRNPARRENLWRANIMASIAEYIIKLEEKHLQALNPDQQSRSISPARRTAPPFMNSFTPDSMWAASLAEVTSYMQSSQPETAEPPSRTYSYDSTATTAACTVGSTGGIMAGTTGPVSMPEHFDLSQVPIDPSLLLDTPGGPSSVHSFSDAHSIASSFDELSQPTIYVGGGTSGGTGGTCAPATSSMEAASSITAGAQPWQPSYSHSAPHAAPGIMLEPPTPMDHQPTGPPLVMMPGALQHSQGHSSQAHSQHSQNSHTLSHSHSRRMSSELDFSTTTFGSEGDDDSSSYSDHSGSHGLAGIGGAAHGLGPNTQTPTLQYSKSRAEAPFDVPENLRVHVALIDSEKEEGSWVETFRKMDGPDADWTVIKQYVPVN